MKIRSRVRLSAVATAVIGLIGLATVPAYANDLEYVDVETTVPTGTNCEAAFVVKNYGGSADTVGLISAGHCDTPAANKIASVNGPFDFEIIGLGYKKIGTVSLANGAELITANFFPRGNVAGGNKGAWTSSDRSNAVNPSTIGSAVVGTPVCRLGGVTGYACGTVQSTNVAPRGAGFSADTYGYLRLDIPCAPGDSGSAVTTADGAQAIGIVSGRRKADGACIVSQLSAIPAAVGGLELYQPPTPDQLFQAYALIDGTHYRVGEPRHRSFNCDAFLRSKGTMMSCRPV